MRGLTCSAPGQRWQVGMVKFDLGALNSSTTRLGNDFEPDRPSEPSTALRRRAGVAVAALQITERPDLTELYALKGVS
jgi:hypothetical protein